MQVDYQKIPAEMRTYRQWVCWRFEDRDASKPTKVPYSPESGRMASVNDASTWTSFEQAVAAAPQYDGIGFVLTKNDPYTFVDLDDTEGNKANFDRQVKIHQEFDSYSERSPSGNGLHIIVKGHIPNGRRRAAVELYSDQRYMTMTGAVFNDKPIAERQNLVQLLWAQMGGGSNTSLYDGSTPALLTDEQVIERASTAINGEKFKYLLAGTWQGIYPSQSEADLAFIDIVAFYTQNAPQIKRLFLASPLGQREKAARPDYVDKMILRSFDRMLPPIDLDIVKNAVEDNKAVLKQISGGTAEVNINGGTPTTDQPITELRNFQAPTRPTPPPGLLGEIAQYIYQSSVRPVAETAIAAAIGLLAGIVGRSYNISGTGLNMYILLLAQTGTGKEAISSGIGKLMSAMESVCPAASDFRGPAEIASGQALLKHISNPNKRCFVSVVGEFGLKMQQLSSSRASSSELMLKRVLLDLYNKSGEKDIVAPSVYAEKDKNTETVKSPSVTIIGESTPETFYQSLDEGLIADGLLPRFMFIEYTGERPARNENHESVQPSLPLVTQLGELAACCLNLHKMERVVKVQCTPEALEFLNKMDKLVDKTINGTKTDVLRHLWNRAHIKTLKLSALVAVGVNYVEPVITLEHAQWAYNMVMSDILSIVARFTRGEIGKNTDENKQGSTILRTCAEYLTAEYRDVKNYGVDACLHEARIIPHSYITRRLGATAIFRNDKMGATAAFKRTIQGLIDAGDLKEVGKPEMVKKYTYSGRAYILADPAKLPAAMK